MGDDSPSFLYKIDSRIKILSLIFLASTSLFINSQIFFVLGILFCLLIFILNKLNIVSIFKSLKPILFLLIITYIFNVLFNGKGDLFLNLRFFKITHLGMEKANTNSLRILFLFLLGFGFTKFTDTENIIKGFETLLGFLKIFKINYKNISLILGLSIKLVPILYEDFKVAVKNNDKSKIEKIVFILSFMIKKIDFYINNPELIIINY